MSRPMTYVEEKRRAEKAAYEARIQELEARLKALQELYHLISEDNWTGEWIVATGERARRRDAEKRIKELEAEVDRMEWVCLDCPLLCRDRERIEELEAQFEGMVPRAAVEKLQTDIAGRDAGIEELEKELADARAEIVRLERELETELDHAKARARRPSNE